VIASNPAWTGIGLHEWLAALLIVPALYHLAINWDWVARTALRIAAKLKQVSRANFVVDVALFLASITVMLSGFMVLPGVASPDGASTVTMVWRHVHSVASDATLLAMLIHLVLHARWMYDTAVRSFLPRPGRHAVGRPALARSRERR
jgi:hypothetical protein